MDIIEANTKTLYHISERKIDALSPSIPDNFLTKNGYEENDTARVCFSTSIDGCLRALSQNCTGMEFYVYMPDDISKYEVFKPNHKEVPDVNITNERWIKSPVKVKCIGKIKVIKSKGDGIEYKYGEYIAKLYDCDWEWIEKKHEATLITEDSIQKSELDNNFKKKSISNINYEVIDFHSPNAKKYIETDSYLSNLYNKNKLKDFNGEIIVDKDRACVIGRVFIGTGKDEGYIGALRVYDKYKGYGFGDILIKDAINKYGGYDLNVFKDNEVALKMYKKYGFEVANTDSSDNSYYMKLKSKMNEASVTNTFEYDNNSIINESLIYGKDKNMPFKSKYIEPDDLFINLEKWQPNENNVLFVTGVSGSGKTTLAIDLAKEVACQRVELDYVAAYYIKKYTENGRGKEKYNNLKVEAPDAVEFLDLNPPESLGYCDKFSDTMTIQDMFIKWFISKVYGNGKLYIVNGAVFVYDEYYDLISNSPCIFKEVNWFKTAYRRTVREFEPDKSFFDNYKSMYKALKTAFKPGYIKANIDAISIRNNIKKYNEYYIEENKAFSTKNLEYNMNKWPNQSNILFITGLSGSGKSTLAAKEAKKYNAVNIEIDLLEHNDVIFDKNTTNDEGNIIIKDYMDKYYHGAHKFNISNNAKAWANEVERFLKYCIDIAKKNKDKNYIIEGIQLMDIPDSIDIIKNYPIIVVNTSMIKSMWQAYKREECGFLEYMKSFKSIAGLKEYIDWYLSMEKDKNKLIKNLKETNVLESTNKILYHGSHKNITGGYIIPKNNSYEDGNYVFGTSDRNFALCYAGNAWHDGIINQGYLNDELYLSEVKENAFENIFNTDGYIYEIVWDDNFYNRGMKTEYLSKEKAKIISKTYIKNVFNEIKKSNINLYYYNDKAPKYIEDKRKSFREEHNDDLDVLYHTAKIDKYIKENGLFKGIFNESRTSINEPLYKIKYDGAEIYEALMARLPESIGIKISMNSNVSWLAKYRQIPSNQDIYYTRRGISEFKRVSMPTIYQLNKYINISKITIDEYNLNANIVNYNPFYVTVSDIRDYTVSESYGVIESLVNKYKFYKVTYNGENIYQAFKLRVSNRTWYNFIKSPAAKWLPKPSDYLNGYESYFTEYGYSMFVEKTLPIFSKYLDSKYIVTEMYHELPARVIYKDKYQIIIDNKIMESTFEDERVYYKIPNVYFSSVISPETLIKLYKINNHILTGNIAVKIHSGEPGNTNFIGPDFYDKFVDYIDGTYVETNTAYDSGRNTTRKHIDVLKQHKWNQYNNVDILDADGDLEIPVSDGKILTSNLVGARIKNYNSCVVLSHCKGHSFGGYGGALKQLSIGFASSRGKKIIHRYPQDKLVGDPSVKFDQNEFLEAMGDAAKSVVDYFNGKMVFISTMKNISVDCDCDGHAKSPCMKDIGILISNDPVAIDQAFIDLVKNSNDRGKDKLLERIKSRNGEYLIEYADKLNIGSRKYNLINIDSFIN